MESIDKASAESMAAVKIEPDSVDTTITPPKCPATYDSWAGVVGQKLKVAGLWGYIDGSEERPEDGKQLNRWKKNDKSARSIISQHLSERDQSSMLVRYSAAREVWEDIEKAYGQPRLEHIWSALMALLTFECDSCAKWSSIISFNCGFKSRLEALNKVQPNALSDKVIMACYFHAISKQYGVFVDVYKDEACRESSKLDDLMAKAKEHAFGLETVGSRDAWKIQQQKSIQESEAARARRQAYKQKKRATSQNDLADGLPELSEESEDSENLTLSETESPRDVTSSDEKATTPPPISSKQKRRAPDKSTVGKWGLKRKKQTHERTRDLQLDKLTTASMKKKQKQY